MNPIVEAAKDGRVADYVRHVYRSKVTSPVSQLAYRGLVREVASLPESSALVFHCTAGKDRTGWAAAVLLSLLGVPREVIIEDYLLSNQMLQAKYEPRWISLAETHPDVPLDAHRLVLGVRADFIQASFDAVDARYGSINAYAEEALGFDKAAIDSLRKRFLVGDPVSL